MVEAGVKVVLEQVLGYCGFFEIGTNHIRRITFNPRGLQIRRFNKRKESNIYELLLPHRLVELAGGRKCNEYYWNLRGMGVSDIDKRKCINTCNTPKRVFINLDLLGAVPSRMEFEKPGGCKKAKLIPIQIKVNLLCLNGFY